MFFCPHLGAPLHILHTLDFGFVFSSEFSRSRTSFKEKLQKQVAKDSLFDAKSCTGTCWRRNGESKKPAVCVSVHGFPQRDFNTHMFSKRSEAPKDCNGKDERQKSEVVLPDA